jgi:hypothetical protein
MAITLISTVTVGAGGQASIDFTSIPSTYTDLMVVLSARTTNAAAGDAILVAFNGVTTNLSSRRLQGDGSSATSSTYASAFQPIVDGNTSTASTFGNYTMYIPNYAGSTNKSFSVDAVNENNATAATQQIWAGLWSQTTAINQLTFTGQSVNFVQYSTASLYGITKGSSGGVTVA